MGCSPPTKRPSEISNTNSQGSQIKGNKENSGAKRREVRKYNELGD